MFKRQSVMKPAAVGKAPAPPSTLTPQPGASTAIGITSERLLRLPELVRTIGVSRATIYRYIDSGRLPPPVKLSTRCTAWRASEITAWIASLRAA
jgi:predicted DNA-binding transcriptional regulator AlpA